MDFGKAGYSGVWGLETLTTEKGKKIVSMFYLIPGFFAQLTNSNATQSHLDEPTNIRVQYNKHWYALTPRLRTIQSPAGDIYANNK